MSLGENRVVVGLGRQTVKGTPVAVTSFPRWGDGTKIEPALTTEKIREGDGTASIAFLIKNVQYWKATIVPTYARAIDIGFLLKALCGPAADTVSGAGPYVHTFAPKLTREYYTVIQQLLLGTPKFIQMSDAMIHSMVIDAQRGKPVKFQFEASGAAGIDSVGAVTPSLDSSSALLMYYGGTFNVDGSTVGNVAPYVTSAKISHMHPLDESMQTEALTLADFLSTTREVTVDLEVLFQDFTSFEKTYFNAGLGPDASAIGTGSLDLTFLAGGSDATNKLRINVPAMHYASAPLPEPKLGGKAFLQKIQATGVVSPDVSYVLTNSQVAAYA